MGFLKPTVVREILGDFIGKKPVFRHTWKDTIRYDESRLLVNLSKGDFVREWWVLLERSFLGSCSSSWSWGCWRWPNVETENIEISPGGAADLLEEISDEKLLHNAINAIKERKESGQPQPAGEFVVANVDLYRTYDSGTKLTPRSFRRLAAFHENCKDSVFNQPGYCVVSHKDDSAIMIADDAGSESESDYLEYLIPTLAEANYLLGGVSVAISKGEIYYLDENQVVGEPINRNWMNLRNVTEGAVVLDVPKLVGSRLMKFVPRSAVRAKSIGMFNLAQQKMAARLYTDGKEFTVKDLKEKRL